MFGASTFGTTVPNTSRSMCTGSTPDRWTSSLTAILPRSIALKCLRSEPALRERRADARDDRDAAAVSGNAHINES